MFSKAHEVLVAEVSNLRAYLETTYAMRGVISDIQQTSEPTSIEFDLAAIKSAAPHATRWRVLEHTLIIGRLYAIYESFFESQLSEWIDFLTKNYRFHQLPQKIVDSYPHGFANIVGMLPSARYPQLNTKDLISSYHGALSGKRNYYLFPECLTHHKNNLRWSDLHEILVKCGVGDFDGWISAVSTEHPGSRFRGEHAIGQISARLRDFIQYRNDSSHGSISTDEILGHDELLELIQFVIDFTKAFDDFIKWKMIEVLLKRGKAILAATVTEVFRKSGAFICITNKVKFQIGQTVFVKKRGDLNQCSIQSLQLNDKNTNIVSAKKGTELGMQLTTLPQKGAQIYMM